MESSNKIGQRKPRQPDSYHEGLAGRLPHPAVQIMSLLGLAVLAQAMHGFALLALGCCVLALAIGISALRLLHLLRRTRWIFISLLLIFAYATPGSPCLAQLGVFSPGCAGVLDGGIQLIRLLTVLAGLSMLLTLLSPVQLTGGLFILLHPVRYLGFSRERLAVRLALTLHYAENAMHDTAHDWRASLTSLSSHAQAGGDIIELELLPFSLQDWLLVIAMGLLVFGVVW